MLRIREYRRVESLEEAYELNQKKTNRIIGGGLWMKIGDRNLMTAIDLSGLGLDQISETEDEFVIGCMATLRDLEVHPGLNAYTDGAVKQSVCHIVGVQFRNCATVGGSIWKIWFFRCTDFICGTGLLCGIIKGWKCSNSGIYPYEL